jgi:hypothetical protein
MVRGMRSMGSAALVRPNQVDRFRCSSFRADTSSSSSPQIRPLQNFCAVAAGQLDLYSEIGCWEWDVCAGTVIATEAGGVLFGGKERDLDRPLDAELITGRKYLVMRGLPDGLEGQKRIAREYFAQAEEWEQQ